MYIQEDTAASYRLLAKSLEQKGYSVTTTSVSPMEVIFTSPKGAIWRTRVAHLAYPFNSEAVRHISINKYEAYEMAKSVGFSIPYTLLITDSVNDGELIETLNTYKKLIVKPADSSLAHGLTIDITSLPELKKAITYAKSFSSAALVQEQVTGEEVRFTVIDGKVEAALLRRTARVMGDGKSSLATLIGRENEVRHTLQFEYLAYPVLDASLIDNSLLTSTRVPAEGEIVELSHSTMIRGGCSVYNILPQVHESYVRAIEGLAWHLGAGFVVIDVFCQKFTEPATPRNHWFIEFNTAPVLKLYYSCRDGRQFDIVPRLAEAIDHKLHASGD